MALQTAMAVSQLTSTLDIPRVYYEAVSDYEDSEDGASDAEIEEVTSQTADQVPCTCLPPLSLSTGIDPCPSSLSIACCLSALCLPDSASMQECESGVASLLSHAVEGRSVDIIVGAQIAGKYATPTSSDSAHPQPRVLQPISP